MTFKPQSFHLTTDDIKKNAISYLAMLPAGKGIIVTFKTEKQARSNAQQTLRWMWCDQIAKEKSGEGQGWDKEDWNRAFKKKWMKHLLIQQSPDFVTMFEEYEDICQVLAENESALLEPYKQTFWDDKCKTKLMNVQTFSKFLDKIDKFAADKLDIILVTPADLEIARGK